MSALKYLPSRLWNSRKVTGQDVELPVEKEGYYRLAFGGEETGCIDYHSSENSLQANGNGCFPYFISYSFTLVLQPSLDDGFLNMCIVLKCVFDSSNPVFRAKPSNHGI